MQSRVFDSWVNTVRERANECKLLKEFHEQAIRHKITFPCTDDPSKLKLYDQGADLSLEKAIQILSLKETSRLELQESKSASIDAIRSERCGNYFGGARSKGFATLRNVSKLTFLGQD